MRNLNRAFAAISGWAAFLQLEQNFAAEVAPGTKLWEFQIGGLIRAAPAIGRNGTIYIGTESSSRIVALNGSTGVLIWENTASSISGSPVVSDDGMLYFFGYGGLSALDGATGISREIGVSPSLLGAANLWQSPTIGSDETIFVSGDDRRRPAMAFDPISRSVRWSVTTTSTVFTSLTIGSEGALFFGALDGKVRAHDGRSGTKLWEYAAIDSPRVTVEDRLGFAMNFSPVLDEDENVYIGSNNGYLFSIRGRDGQLNWKSQLSGMPYWPALDANDSIYVGTSAKKVYSLDRRTGKKLWEFNTAGGISSSPAVAADGTVYVGCEFSSVQKSGGKLYALDGRTGKDVWEFDAKGSIFSSPVIGADGTIYVAASNPIFDGKIYAIKGTATLAASAWPMFGRNPQHTGRAADRPPVIAQHPQNQVVALGTTALFTVTASGSPGVHHWWHDGELVAKGASSTLTLTNVQPKDAGRYSVVITNPVGTAVSQSATLVLHNSLTVQVTGPGRVKLDPDLPTYPPGTVATLTPEPLGDNYFFDWSGDAKGDEMPLKVVVDRNLFVSARFVDTTLRLTVLGMGTITATPDTRRLPPKTEVVLTAMPGRWHRFARWLDGSTDNPRSVRIGAENNYTAVFDPTEPLVTVVLGGVSRLAPIGMPAILLDGVFTLTNAPLKTNSVQIEVRTTFQNGSIFYTLDGSVPSFLSREYSGPFFLTQPASLRAIAYTSDFTKSSATDPLLVTVLPAYPLNVFTRGGGSFRVDPGQGPYLVGTRVSLTAIPASGWVFLGWRGSISSFNPTALLEIDSPKTVEAVFGTTVTVTPIGSGRVQLVPPNPIPYGSNVRLTALPDAGNFFFRWADAAVGSFSPLEMVVTQSGLSVSALFGPLSPTQTALTVLVEGNGRVEAVPAKNMFATGESVTLRAISGTGGKFIRWELDGNGKNSPLAVVMNRDMTIRAVFSPATVDRPSLEVVSTLPFRFRFKTQRGISYSVEASNDARQWLPIGNVIGTEATEEFVDPRKAIFFQQFYRIRVE